MDIRMPVLDGVEATRRIADAGLATRVLVLTTFDLDEYAFAALKAGASWLHAQGRPPHRPAQRHPQRGRRGRRGGPLDHTPAARPRGADPDPHPGRARSAPRAAHRPRARGAAGGRGRLHQRRDRRARCTWPRGRSRPTSDASSPSCRPATGSGWCCSPTRTASPAAEPARAPRRTGYPANCSTSVGCRGTQRPHALGAALPDRGGRRPQDLRRRDAGAAIDVDASQRGARRLGDDPQPHAGGQHLIGIVEGLGGFVARRCGRLGRHSWQLQELLPSVGFHRLKRVKNEVGSDPVGPAAHRIGSNTFPHGCEVVGEGRVGVPYRHEHQLAQHGLHDDPAREGVAGAVEGQQPGLSPRIVDTVLVDYAAVGSVAARWAS
jgi:CheY-like chemotaxis protein